jgi:hypothetical protein
LEYVFGSVAVALEAGCSRLLDSFPVSDGHSSAADLGANSKAEDRQGSRVVERYFAAVPAVVEYFGELMAEGEVRSATAALEVVD